jgi:hypothetical protein
LGGLITTLSDTAFNKEFSGADIKQLVYFGIVILTA